MKLSHLILFYNFYVTSTFQNRLRPSITQQKKDTAIQTMKKYQRNGAWEQCLRRTIEGSEPLTSTSLPLATGLSALCKETCTQKGIQPSGNILFVTNFDKFSKRNLKWSEKSNKDSGSLEKEQSFFYGPAHVSFDRITEEVYHSFDFKLL